MAAPSDVTERMEVRVPRLSISFNEAAAVHGGTIQPLGSPPASSTAVADEFNDLEVEGNRQKRNYTRWEGKSHLLQKTWGRSGDVHRFCHWAKHLASPMTYLAAI
jgi:hypothetical protein